MEIIVHGTDICVAGGEGGGGGLRGRMLCCYTYTFSAIYMKLYLETCYPLVHKTICITIHAPYSFIYMQFELLSHMV